MFVCLIVLFVCLFVCLSVCLSVCLFVCLFVCFVLFDFAKYLFQTAELSFASLVAGACFLLGLAG